MWAWIAILLAVVSCGLAHQWSGMLPRSSSSSIIDKVFEALEAMTVPEFKALNPEAIES